jgi:hypothetical protein
LRALGDMEPILCILDLPLSASRYPWFQATWEALIGWAYVSAQRFVRRNEDIADNAVVVAPDIALQQYLKLGGLPSEVRLRDALHHMNLVTLGKSSEKRDFTRLKARWPGPTFCFHPEWLSTSQTDLPEPLRRLIDTLCIVGGKPKGVPEKNLNSVGDISPLRLLVWAREAAGQVLAGVSAGVAEIVSSGTGVEKFRGSNEAGMALALKATPFKVLC